MGYMIRHNVTQSVKRRYLVTYVYLFNFDCFF